MATHELPDSPDHPDPSTPMHDVFGRQLSRRALLQGAVAAGAALTLGRPLDALAAPRAKRGGRLRIGLAGGGAAETLNVTQLRQEIDTMRALILYDRLVDITPSGKLFNNLAEEFSPNKNATVWKIKLRDATFHNGKKLEAADVVYTFRYILDPKNATTGAPLFSSLFRSQDISAVDKTTVQVKLKRPLAILPNSFSSQQYGVFPEGTTTWDHPIGTGAFMFDSWKRGERSLFKRYPDYRKPGRPYLDEIEIIAINDSTALYNALVGGQIDALPRLSPSLVAGVKSNSRLQLLQGPTGVHTDMTMSVDLDPFRDNRVREAFRLMVDRQQMVSNALGGNGRIGNDLPTPYDADFDGALPQRQHDPEKAKALLEAAGKEGLTVSLYTSDAGPAMLESATLFAEQAKAAGVTVNLDKVSADHYYDASGKFLKAPFAQDTWSYRTLPNALADAYVSAAPFNETHWKRPAFDRLVAAAERTLNPARRHQLWLEVQKELWNEGGFIIWGFIDNLDAVSAKVHGIKKSVARPLGRYDFTDTYLA